MKVDTDIIPDENILEVKSSLGSSSALAFDERGCNIEFSTTTKSHHEDLSRYPFHPSRLR